jgi:NitT/TauT family transport system permease protein
MAKQAKEMLLDVRVVDASKLYKFYLNQEKKILGTVSVVLFLAVWELVGNVYQWIKPLFMSAPSLILKAAIELLRSGEIWNDLYVSGVEFFWGFILSVVVGIPFGIAVGWYKRAAYIFDPFVNAMNATPRVALLPLIIIWLGIGILSKVGIIFLGSVFPLMINTRDGVKTTPGQSSQRRQKLWCFSVADFRKRCALPSTLPFILTGLRLAVGRALIRRYLLVSSMPTAGIGFMVTVAAGLQTDKVFVGILIFIIVGLVGTNALDRVERRFDKWRPKVGADQ